MSKMAVVFDGSGVLYDHIRITKDIEKNEVFHLKTSGVNIADTIPRSAIAILRTDPAMTMERAESSIILSDFLASEDVQIRPVYKTDQSITDEEVERVVLSDKNVRLKDVQDTISYLRRYETLPGIGTGVIVDLDNETANGIRYLITGGGNLFPRLHDVTSKLKSWGIALFVASGDRIEKETIIPDVFGIPSDNLYGMMAPDDKRRCVASLKERYEKVIFIGDGKNDILAMEEADVAVLAVQVEAERPKELFEVADFVIKEIIEVIGIIENL